MRLSAGRGSAPGFIPVTDGVYLLREPFGGTTTGIILLRSAENILIDAGGSAALVDSVLVPALAAQGLAPRDIDVCADAGARRETNCRLHKIGR